VFRFIIIRHRRKVTDEIIIFIMTVRYFGDRKPTEKHHGRLLCSLFQLPVQCAISSLYSVIGAHIFPDHFSGPLRILYGRMLVV